MAFNIDSLTLGEVAKIEELSHAPIGAIADEAQPKGKALAACAFVIERRTNPAFTWGDAMNLTFDQAKTILGITDEEDEEDEEGDVVQDPTPWPAASV